MTEWENSFANGPISYHFGHNCKHAEKDTEQYLCLSSLCEALGPIYDAKKQGKKV